LFVAFGDGFDCSSYGYIRFAHFYHRKRRTNRAVAESDEQNASAFCRLFVVRDMTLFVAVGDGFDIFI